MFAVLLPIFLLPVGAQRSLIFVEALWRHGDRAPIDLPYPTDPYTESSWSRGFGHLTNLGMGQMKELGSFFADRYKPVGHIGEQFDPKQVYFRSSDSDRALSSAQAFTYGLYPAKGKYRFEDGLPWQPVAVHSSTPGEVDLLCKPTKAPCPLYDKLVKISDDQDAELYNSKYSRFFEEVGPQIGIDNCTFLDINGMYDVYRELVHNLTEKQPAWVFKTWPEYHDRSSMDIVLEMRTARMNNQYDSAEKAKMYGGYLLNTWIHNAQNAVSGNCKYNTMLYSSHDGTLLALLNALGIGNQLMVPYASALILEVYRDVDNSTFVDVLYRNDSSTEPYYMELPYCTHPCSVDKFAESYKNMTLQSLEDVEQMCRSASSIKLSFAVLLILAMFP